MSSEASVLPSPPADYAQRMPRFEEATTLGFVGLDAFGRELRLIPEAAAALAILRQAAAEAGLSLLLISGFRSVERQTEIIRRKLEAGRALGDILRENAYPGFSEHHTGRAIDFGSPDCEHLTEAFETTREFAWLQQRAADFGFVMSYPRDNTTGIMYEPWHWCWGGRAQGGENL